MAASVKDVAKAAGVSLGTVSNVLNRPHLVRASTRARVERAMDELKFVRNEPARQLRGGRSRTIAYIVLDSANPFFADVARGIEDRAEEADLCLYLCNSHNRADQESSYLSRLEEQRVQGVLITPVDPESSLLDALPSRGTPVVLVDRTRSVPSHCTVAVDDVLGGKLAVEHLIAQGHERIAYVGGPETIGQVRDRRDGALTALRRAGRPVEALVPVPTQALTVVEGMRAADAIASMPSERRPTAAFCANDLLALGLLQRCSSLGTRVPDDLAVLGYDDIDFAAAAAVPLSSVRQPRHQLGKSAAELLIDEATNPDHEHQQLLFTPELVVRASTGSLQATMTCDETWAEHPQTARDVSRVRARPSRSIPAT